MRNFCSVVLLTAVFCSSINPILSGDEITIVRNGKSTELAGHIVVEAEDNSILFCGRDGQLLILKPDEIQGKKVEGVEVEPLTRKELGKQMLKELPADFKIHEAGQFVIEPNGKSLCPLGGRTVHASVPRVWRLLDQEEEIQTAEA